MAKPVLLILGGTALAAELARQASAMGIATIYSLAGRTRAIPIAGVEMRSGGFGGAEQLAAYLSRSNITMVVDGTHAYAAQISRNSEAACNTAEIPLLRLQQPAWERQDGDHWINATDIAATRELAADLALDIAGRVFVTTGRQAMGQFADDRRCWWLSRVIAPGPDLPILANGQYIFARGPFALADESRLLREYEISAVISKNAGGTATYAKIEAAREHGLPVIMIDRPSAGTAPLATDTEAALTWMRARIV
ncbi:MAG: cobalt-precorrin-6A reductase [Rhodospirillaceae bacterium]|jgi:precorrin-6A/cobalt-precorrin-6A reductase|nr:cobalt-precorrin-6A reductase [Rhodospirillaceae bacterium]MBT5193519.1 cobalt-precorrin-6A reductase [Rhodospirillaceae bacterium]MBT5894615.1 cobalt-precorrin-6A reductase [Rhodospirillaceae bacterium]MBT7756449.1 cobalt-precorrin-6A reductase [Rhodospirillaceae bacterium]